jgi:hypothetical protein
MVWQPLGHSLRGPAGASPVLLPQTLLLSSPTAGLRVPIQRAVVDLTLTRIDLLLVGSNPQLTCSLRIGADFSAAGAEVVSGGILASSTTTGDAVTSFDESFLPAGSWLWLETSGPSGTIDALHLSVYLVAAGS